MKRTKLPALLLALAIALSLMPSAFAAGTSPYTKTLYLEDADDLMELAALCRLDTWSVGKRVVLKADISLEDVAFPSIPSFAGLFDGNGHTISGFALTGTVTPSGFFGTLQATGAIRDLTVSGSVLPGGDARSVGGLVGENYGTISNCTFTGNVAGSGSTGGIVGINALSGTVTGCDVSGLVIGADMTGGIAGCNLGSITACVNKASVNTVSVDPSIDPSSLSLDFLTDVSKLTSLDISSAATDTGGIAGYSSGILKSCTNKASVGYPHIGYNVGGIVGRSCGHVASCTNTAEINGRKDVGGIAGQMEPSIEKSLSESELAALERQLTELDDLLDTALEHADGASAALTDCLNGISSSVGSAASAAQDIRTTGTITGSATGSVDGSTDGSIAVTPIEGELGGAIQIEDGSVSVGGIQLGDGSVSGGTFHVGEGSVSAGIGGAVSGSAAGAGDASIGAGLDAQAQIDISTDLAGLSAALSGMAGQMRMLSGELAGASEELLADAAQIKDKIREITECGFDLLLGGDDEALLIDDSAALDIDQITSGKVSDCANSGAVTGDINIGGIVGALGMEYALDPEDDLHVSLDGSTKRSYELRAVVHRCKNTGKVLSKRNYTGGIVGKMDLGLVAECGSYGSVCSESGNYVGGIAGLCGATVRHCFAKCSLSGGKYVGGIVGSGVEETVTGASSTVAACCSIVTITDHEQYIGAISGACAGTFLENCFVSEELAGINGLSYTGCAQPLTYTELLARFDGAAETGLSLPDEFRKFQLTFVADGEVLASDVFDYGASFPDDTFPDLPQKKGYYACWDRTELSDLRFDTTVTAVYEPYISALASTDVRSGEKVIFFAEGDFGETDTLTAAAMPLTPDAFHLAGGLLDIIEKSLTDGKINTEVVEQWQLSISGDDTAAHTIRYLPPDADAAHMDVYALLHGEWVELETEIIGSYVAFSIAENDVQLAIVHSRSTWWAWLIAGALLLAVLFLLVRAARRLLKRQPAHPPAPEKAALVTEAPASPVAPAKKRRWLTPLLVFLALLLGILGTSAFFLLPELLANRGACVALAVCLEKDILSMTLQVDAQIGQTGFPITADLTRTRVNGESVTAISQNGRTLYYADGTVFLDDGTAYRVSASLPDYSQLLEQATALYRHVDAEASGDTYSLTATGEDAKALLELLLPSVASSLAEPERMRVELVTEAGSLSQIQFHGNGTLRDAASTYRVDATLCVLSSPASVSIPDAVAEALASAEHGASAVLSDDLSRLLGGWQALDRRASWSASASLRADCGPLELQEELTLCRWLVDDVSICSVQENGYGLYVSGNAVCDRNGNTVSVSAAPTLDAAKLLELLYDLCRNASADCAHSGGTDTYTLTLDAEGMASLAHVIVPETEKPELSFTSGTARIVMEQDEISRVEIAISGSVPVVLSKADASITAALDFTTDAAPALPDAVKTALVQK